jgi:hypothetical protein
MMHVRCHQRKSANVNCNNGSAGELVEIGALNRAASGLLGRVDDGHQGIIVIRVARQRLGVKHEPWAWDAGVSEGSVYQLLNVHDLNG